MVMLRAVLLHFFNTFTYKLFGHFTVLMIRVTRLQVFLTIILSNKLSFGHIILYLFKQIFVIFDLFPAQKVGTWFRFHLALLDLQFQLLWLECFNIDQIRGLFCGDKKSSFLFQDIQNHIISL